MDITAIKEQVEQHWNEYVADLTKIVAVPSVRGEAAPNAPFGVEPRRALDVAVGIADGYGFKTGIVNDAMAYVQWGDDDEHYIGIFGHLDVVPAGDGWTTPPFELNERDGRLYARGILDNKGPIWTNLFAMHLLKDAGITPKHTIRIVLGSDEENGSHDVPLYFEGAADPEFGYTPDNKWPAVYGERGIVNYRVHTPLPDDAAALLGDIEGDQAKDHVPDDLKVTIGNHALNIKGVRTPTNAPEMGQNAITLLAKQVKDDHLVDGPLGDYFTWLADSLHNKHNGEGLRIAFEDEDSGKLIVTPYLLEKTAGGIDLELAMRYPVTFTEDDVTKGLEAAVPAGSTVTVVRSLPGTMHDKTDPRVLALSQLYEDVTGLDGKPLTTTGATYARQVPNIIAYGPSFPGQKGIAHKEDEWMAVSDLKACMAIYMAAIQTLAEKG